MRRRDILLATLILAVAMGAGAWGLFLKEKPLPVTTDSKVAYQWYEKGVENREKFFWSEAEHSFEKAVEADSNFAMAWIELATARRNLENREGSKQALKRAHELREMVHEDERLYIDYYYDVFNGEHDQAMAVLDELAEKYPNDVRSILIRARQAWTDGDTDQAIRLYEKSLAIDPTMVMSHNQLGYLYLEKGDYPTAIANLQRYAYYANDQPNPHDSLGEAYDAAGEYDKAIQEYLKALEIRPTFYHSALHLATTLAVTGQVHRARYAIDQAKKAMTEQGVSTRYLPVQRIRIESLGMRPEKVLQLCDAELTRATGDIEDDPARIGILLNVFTFRTFALIELGRLDEAEESMRNASTYWQKVVEKSGQPMGSSMKSLGTIVGGLLKAKLSVARGVDYRAAAAEITKALDESSSPPHRAAFWHYDLGRIEYEAGDYDAALQQADRILSIIPTFPYMNLLAAQADAKLGRTDAALQRVKTYLRVMALADEDHPGVRQARELEAKLQAP